jgi:fructose 1,6-bisphosphate aldolase/phosphatase
MAFDSGRPYDDVPAAGETHIVRSEWHEHLKGRDRRRGRGSSAMRITVSVIKADVGSVGGHTKPSPRMLEGVRSEVSKAMGQSLLVDGFVSHTGNDIAIIMSHRRGKGHPDIHGFAWNTFLNATQIAREYGLYGAGQDLLVDAP